MWEGPSAVTLFAIALALGGCAGRAPVVEHPRRESAAASDEEPAPRRERGVRRRSPAARALPRGTEVTYEAGVPATLRHPSAQLVVEGLTSAAGAPVALHPDGSVEEICLGRAATLGGHSFPAGTALYLDEDGFAAVLEEPTYFPSGRFVTVAPTARPDCRPSARDPATEAMLERMADEARHAASGLERCRPLVAAGPPRPVVLTVRLDAEGRRASTEPPSELEGVVAACAEDALRGLDLDGASEEGFTVSILWYLGACGSAAECHEAYVRTILGEP